MINTHVNVLDKGYVRLIDVLGDDLHVVNSARASFNKRSEKIDDKDERLIRFLLEHGHTSTLRHCAVCLEIKAPLFVARQLFKYHVAVNATEAQDGWNENSYRYITLPQEFYIPNADDELSGWRAAPDNKKQGSAGMLERAVAVPMSKRLERFYEHCMKLYNEALEAGIAPEQARLFLPAYGLYINWWWTLSLEAVLWMLTQRLDRHAQGETRAYAQAILQVVEPLYPYTFKAWKDLHGN